MEYKFKVGDIVEIITNGSGYSSDAVGCHVTILELGVYDSKIGYRTTIPERGRSNAESGKYNYMAGEDSFKLISSGNYNYEVY